MNRERRIAGRRIRRRRRIVARLDATISALDVKITPWQRVMLLAALDGEQPHLMRGRRYGG